MKIGIKKLLFLTTFFSAALPMLLVGIISLNIIKSHLRNEMEQESMLFSGSIAKQIHVYLREPIRELALARDHIDRQRHGTSMMEDYFNDLIKTHDYFESIYRLDRSGKVHQVTNRKNSEEYPDLHGIDFSIQPSFLGAIRDKRPSWSNSQMLSGGAPTLALGLPARDGVILATLRLNELSRIINEASNSHYYTAFIVEKGGRIIAHPDDKLVARRENVGSLPLLSDSAKKTRSGYLDFQNVRYHALVVPIQETEWQLVVARRLEIAEKPINTLENTFIFGIGFMLLLVTAGAIAGNRIISRPFKQMMEQSRLVAEGRFDEVVSVDSSCEEIAMLSDTVTAMATEVHQREMKMHDQNDELLVTEEMLRTQIDEYHETHDQLVATEEMLRVQLEVSESNQLKLSEANSKLGTMINSSPLAIISLDQSGLIGLWNQKAKTLFGGTAEEIGHTLEKLFVSEKNYGEFISNLISDPHLRIPEQLLRSLDNRSLLVSLVSAPISAASENLEYILMIEDITLRTQLEDQLRQAQKMDVVGQLAGGIAHDFNNMLAAIMASAELLKLRMPEDDRNIKMVNTILNAATRSADLTRDLLAFSRKGSRENSPVSVNNMITAVIGLLEHTIDKNIRLEARLTAGNPIVLGDPTLLQNAMLNLGVNARDAMPEGGTLSYSTSLVFLASAENHNHMIPLKPGNYLQISVSDTGVGIHRDLITKIFEPFFTTKEHGKGTGLGLAAVYGTVRDHQGGISVDSEPGHGTVFNVYLPLGTSELEQDKQDNALIKGCGGVLLIDDEEILRCIGQELLEELGYTVYLAEGGAEGLKTYARYHDSISLVLLDMLMPELSGVETFKRLREIDPDVRVLFCSGFHNEGTDCQLRDLGAKGFIQKPYTLTDLGIAIAKTTCP